MTHSATYSTSTISIIMMVKMTMIMMPDKKLMVIPISIATRFSCVSAARVDRNMARPRRKIPAEMKKVVQQSCCLGIWQNWAQTQWFFKVTLHLKIS